MDESKRRRAVCPPSPAPPSSGRLRPRQARDDPDRRILRHRVRVCPSRPRCGPGGDAAPGRPSLACRLFFHADAPGQLRGRTAAGHGRHRLSMGSRVVRVYTRGPSSRTGCVSRIRPKPTGNSSQSRNRTRTYILPTTRRRSQPRVQRSLFITHCHCVEPMASSSDSPLFFAKARDLAVVLLSDAARDGSLLPLNVFFVVKHGMVNQVDIRCAQQFRRRLHEPMPSLALSFDLPLAIVPCLCSPATQNPTQALCSVKYTSRLSRHEMTQMLTGNDGSSSAKVNNDSKAHDRC